MDSERLKGTHLFSIVSAYNYHERVFSLWLRLVKDGLVPKDNATVYADFASYCTGFIMNRKELPEYDVAIAWASQGA